MSAPNIVNVSTITGKTAVLNVGTTAAAIVTNAASSGQVLKVNALYVSNVDASSNYKITVEIYRSAASYYIAYQTSFAAASTYDLLSKAIYLEEGDSLRVTADAANKLVAVCSYEVIA